MPSPVITELGYLGADYLEDPYGSSRVNAAYGMQASLVRAMRFGMQATLIIYNITQPRILDDFPSRGTPALGGNNWTTTSQAPGDFLPRNLNTDIEEQVFRSAGFNVTLTCDTGVTQGVTIDTLAIRSHNLTSEANVQLQGSKDNFATNAVVINLPMERTHSYYIAPQFPIGTANQNRYWRLVISDPNNPDGYVQIGTIVFGNARIMSKKENYENPITKGYTHFKDSLPTEGFTSTSNDRALKKKISLTFTDLERSAGNFRLIESYYLEARTSLKALIIPKPTKASRYAVFAKLASMPEESERDVSDDDADIDTDADRSYISLTLSWDEAL